MTEIYGKIAQIEEKTAKNGNVFKIFHVNDGQKEQKYATFNPDLMDKVKTGDDVKLEVEKNEKTGFTDLKNIEKSEQSQNSQAPAQTSAPAPKSQQNGSDDLQRQILAEVKANGETLRSILLHLQKVSESLKKEENGN